jgi:hypothetical protein
VKYVLVEWLSEGETPRRVGFRAEDLGSSIKLDRLTDRVLVAILHILDEAKLSNPRGFYRPITHNPSDGGDEIYVLRDGFELLEHIFVPIVQGLLDEYKERRVKDRVLT